MVAFKKKLESLLFNWNSEGKWANRRQLFWRLLENSSPAPCPQKKATASCIKDLHVNTETPFQRQTRGIPWYHGKTVITCFPTTKANSSQANRHHQPLTGHPSWAGTHSILTRECVANWLLHFLGCQPCTLEGEVLSVPLTELRTYLYLHRGGAGGGNGEIHPTSHTDLFYNRSKGWNVNVGLRYVNSPTEKNEHDPQGQSLRPGNLISGTSYSCIHSTNTWVPDMCQIRIQALGIEEEMKHTEIIALGYKKVNGVKEGRNEKKMFFHSKIINWTLTLGCPMPGWRNDGDPKENQSLPSWTFQSSLEHTVVTNSHKLMSHSSWLNAMKKKYPVWGDPGIARGDNRWQMR